MVFILRTYLFIQVKGEGFPVILWRVFLWAYLSGVVIPLTFKEGFNESILE